MANELADEQTLMDAALVRAASRRVDEVLADLAARPLDERVAAQMRTVLEERKVTDARDALARLEQTVNPRSTRRLHVVATDESAGDGAA